MENLDASSKFPILSDSNERIGHSQLIAVDEPGRLEKSRDEKWKRLEAKRTSEIGQGIGSVMFELFATSGKMKGSSLMREQ
jgi:hypothetical protein